MIETREELVATFLPEYLRDPFAWRLRAAGQPATRYQKARITNMLHDMGEETVDMTGWTKLQASDAIDTLEAGRPFRSRIGVTT